RGRTGASCWPSAPCSPGTPGPTAAWPPTAPATPLPPPSSACTWNLRSVFVTRAHTWCGTVGDAVAVLEGEDLELQCSADASQPPQYEWSRQGDDWVVASSTLTLPHVSREQAGTYVCRAQHPSLPHLARSRAVRLDVEGAQSSYRLGELGGSPRHAPPRGLCLARPALTPLSAPRAGPGPEPPHAAGGRGAAGPAAPAAGAGARRLRPAAPPGRQDPGRGGARPAHPDLQRQPGVGALGRGGPAAPGAVSWALPPGTGT
uniref:Ig-like domain-containing protein n=1 Tax=Chrysemys picta bellii TaxID=8478 RepID=A0A8C3HM97_CHRPI